MTSSSEGVRGHVSIDDGFSASVRGEAQWITLRGADVANPPLLILSGPGIALSRMAPFFAPWEATFTLVQWDQPGAGATFARNGETPLSLDRLAADAEAVVESVLARIGVAKLAVLGISGGSLVGLKLAKARPDLLSAYVGTGQIVHWARQQALGYRLALDEARLRGDMAAIAELEVIGPPPYGDIADEIVLSRHANAPTEAERDTFASLDPATAAALATPPDGARYVPPALALPDPRERAMAAFTALRAEIAGFDAWALRPRFDVPLFFLQGDLDHYTPTAEVTAFAAQVEAPSVEVVVVPGGGHSAVFMRDTVLQILQSRLPRSTV
jgi:pimeloyl-ACP methyl ester carboxylesterase